MEQEILKEVFPSLEKELLQELVTKSESRHFKEGEQLVRTGQYFRSTMIVISGLVKIYREDQEGSEFFMYHLQPGQGCALSMICATRREASAIMAKAVKDTEVIFIPLEYMDQWMRTYQSWYQFVMETYRSRFEDLLVTIDHIAFRGMDERLEFYLQKHRDTLQSDIIETSHQEIADELNSSREVISRLLKKMEQLGRVKLHRNAIELLTR